MEEEGSRGKKMEVEGISWEWAEGLCSREIFPIPSASLIFPLLPSPSLS
jgi:hypothetical protein